MKKIAITLILFVFFAFAQHGYAEETPSRVVSLVPAITEILFAIGADDSLKGIPYQSVYPPGTERISNVGSAFSPSLKAIAALKPDLIFLAPFQGSIGERFKNSECRLEIVDIRSIRDLYNHIDLLGSTFRKPEQAEKLKDEIRSQIEIIQRKIEKIPDTKRKRVIRVVGQDRITGQDGMREQARIMVPGDDSFQNALDRCGRWDSPAIGPKRKCRTDHERRVDRF